MSATLAMIALLVAAPGYGSPQTSDDAETIYSGTVESLTAEKLTVSREVLGKPAEYMTFALTAQTKIEGKLQEGVRVTVKFRPSDEGSIAETIIVRETAPRPKKKN